MFKTIVFAITLFSLVGCATAANVKLETPSKVMIDGKAVYIGQSKASVESALGAPDKAEFTATYMDRNIVGYYPAIRWDYVRGETTYTLLFRQNGDCVTFIDVMTQVKK